MLTLAEKCGVAWLCDGTKFLFNLWQPQTTGSEERVKFIRCGLYCLLSCLVSVIKLVGVKLKRVK